MARNPDSTTEKKIIFKMVGKLLGSHVHFRVFAGKTLWSLGFAGELCLREEEYHLFYNALRFGALATNWPPTTEVEVISEVADVFPDPMH